MPFVKIHVCSYVDPAIRTSIVSNIREMLVDVLGISLDHGHVVLYESPVTSRCVHESRNNRFVIVEILMFSGRSEEMKEKLFYKMNEIIKNHLGIEGRDVIISIIESERNNWARDGIPLSKINLEY